MIFFFFNDTATTEIYTLSLHDALPICQPPYDYDHVGEGHPEVDDSPYPLRAPNQDRKSTRLNSSHANISYAVFCLKKKKKYNYDLQHEHICIYNKETVDNLALDQHTTN